MPKYPAPAFLAVLLLLPPVALSKEPSSRRTVYGLRPYGVTDIANKNTADEGGLVNYYFTGYLNYCELTCEDNVFTQYVIESTGGWDHNYSMCNPQSSNWSVPYRCDYGDQFYVGVADPGGACEPNTWYSTPVKGDCAINTPCSWSVVTVGKVVNSTCITDRLDDLIKPYATSCTHRCRHRGGKAPTQCEKGCYANSFLYQYAKNRALMCNLRQVVVNAFASTDPAAGGCPARVS